MAAGPGRIHPETGIQLECPVVAGDSVIYGKYDGTEMRYNDVNHQLIKDDDVLLKYTGNDLKFANCEPVKDQVMIKLKGKDATSASGIIVNAVDNKDVRIDCGVVAKVGPGRQAGNGAVMPIQVSYTTTLHFYFILFYEAVCYCVYSLGLYVLFPYVLCVLPWVLCVLPYVLCVLPWV